MLISSISWCRFSSKHRNRYHISKLTFVTWQSLISLAHFPNFVRKDRFITSVFQSPPKLAKVRTKVVLKYVLLTGFKMYIFFKMCAKNTILWTGEGWIESGMEENTRQGTSWLIQFTYNVSVAESERLKLALTWLWHEGQEVQAYGNFLWNFFGGVYMEERREVGKIAFIIFLGK
jgi:hypothetical protein